MANYTKRGAFANMNFKVCSACDEQTFTNGSGKYCVSCKNELVAKRKKYPGIKNKTWQVVCRICKEKCEGAKHRMYCSSCYIDEKMKRAKKAIYAYRQRQKTAAGLA